MNIYLIRIEWTENNYIRYAVYLIQRSTMQKAVNWVLRKFKKTYPFIYSKKGYRITWAENFGSKLEDKHGILIYSHGPFGIHDPFCSSNRGKT